MATERTTPDELSMSDHPDIVELRERLDRAAETPQAKAVEGLAVIAGLYAAISPWVVDFHTGNASLTVSNLIIGLAAALVALELGSAYSRAHGMSWLLPILGAWIIVSQWVIQSTTLDVGVVLSNIIVGACIVLLGAAAVGVPRMRRPHHR